MDNLISLDNAVPQDQPISLGEASVGTLDSGSAKSRAAKAEFGLGPVVGQDFDTIHQQINDGQENTFRQGAAAAIDNKNQQHRQQALVQAAATKPLSLKEIHDLTSGVPPTNPDTVIEKAYADAYVKQLKEAAQRIDDNVLTTADTEDPEKVEKFFRAGSDVLSTREYFLSQAQNIQADVDNDVWGNIPFFKTPWTPEGKIPFGSKTSPFSGVMDMLGNFNIIAGLYSGVRNEYLMRGNTKETNRLAGIFQGSNLLAQSQELMSLPTFEERKEMFDKGFERLKQQSPALAQQWAVMMAGLSTNDLIVRNVMTPINLVGAGAATRSIKDILGGIGRNQVKNVGGGPPPPSSGNLSAGPDGVYRPSAPASTPNTEAVMKAVEDVLRTSPASPTKANVAEAVGDAREAATQKAIVSFTKPDPQRDAVDTLLDMHRTNQEDIKRFPGNNSREAHTRIIDAGESFDKNIVDVLKNDNQIIRLPALAEEGFRSVATRANRFFNGRENTIVNVDMHHDVTTNTEWHVYTLGNYDGSPFWSLKAAENHAVNQGYGKPKLIGIDPEVVYLPKVAVLENKYTDNFITEKGSVYELHDDGTTTRNKGHGPDTGYKPRSLKTGYLTPEELATIEKTPKDKYAVDASGDKIRIFTDKDNFAFIQARHDEPKVGLHPVEILPNNKIHYGNKITHVLPSHMDVQPRSNFVHEKGPNGWGFYLDDPHGTRAEVLPSVEPGPTDIPFNLKTGKFGQPLAIGPHIVQKGIGYHIKWMIPLNEQDNWLRENHLIKSDRQMSSSSPTSTKRSFFNDSFLGYLRLPQDTLSAAENENRFKLVYGENRYLKLIKNEMQHVENLYNGVIKQGKTSYLDAAGGVLTGRNSQLWNDFKRALTISQKLPDPDTGLPGYYMRTPAEIHHFWNVVFNRSPSEAEQQAYLAVGRMDYADWVFRNISVFKNKARLGVMEHVHKTFPEGSNSGEAIRSAPFEGRFISKIPEGNVPVVIMEKDGGVRYYNSMGVKAKQAFKDEMQQKGYRAIQLYNPDNFDIKIFDKNRNPVRVVYVISNSLESSPISYKQVGYRGGGHWDYNYNYYVKQPMIRKFEVGGKTHWVYSGDSTFVPIKNHADGQAFTGKLNQIISLLRDKKVKDAKALHQSYSDMEWKDFVKNFYPRKNERGELVPSRFNLDEDFRVIPKGFTIGEYDKNLIKKYEAMPGKFVNSARGEQSLARNFQVEYTGARDSHDLFEPINTGTINNPMYKFQPAELTDPVTVLLRSLRRITQSQMGDDYKYSAVEHWLQENMNMLTGRPEEIRGAPFATFMNGELNRRFRMSMAGQAAESNRYKIKKLIGMPTAIDSEIHRWKQALADEIFNTDSKIKKSVLIPAEWTLGNIHSPTAFIRGMAFHQTMGFWNWAQIAAQNMGWVLIAGMSPDHTMAGLFGAWMHHWSLVNNKPAILKGLGKLTEKLIQPWKPGEWEEARNILNNTNFADIANTLAINDTQKQFLTSLATKGVRQGTTFFNWAESNVRIGAFYTAFHEFKRAFPNKKIDQTDIAKISARANDMYANMGRDSKTLLNTGIGSVTLQFFKYIENVGQIFFSKRIGDVFGQENTWATRARRS